MVYICHVSLTLCVQAFTGTLPGIPKQWLSQVSHQSQSSMEGPGCQWGRAQWEALHLGFGLFRADRLSTIFIYLTFQKKKNHLKKVLLLSIRKRITVLKNFCGSCFLWQESGACWTPRCPQEQRSLQTNTFFPVRNNPQKFMCPILYKPALRQGRGQRAPVLDQSSPIVLFFF